MNVTHLPFNAYVGIIRAERDEFVLALRMGDHLRNHLGTMHASALFALAEATSGEFLIHSRGARSDIGGVVRRNSSKYSRPAHGDVFSRVKTPVSSIAAAIDTVDSRGKTLVEIDIEIVDEGALLVASFGFSWLLAANDPNARDEIGGGQPAARSGQK